MLPTHLLHSAEVVGEVWHEVGSGIRSNKEPYTTEVGSGVARNERVSDPTNHLGEANESLSELTVRQEAVALQNGRLNIANERRSQRNFHIHA